MLDQHLLPRDFTLAEGLRFYADLYGIASPAERIVAVAKRVGLHGRLADRLRGYSRGMGQRASLARALLHDPQVLLLDEPFNGLDAAGCAIIEEVIAEAKSRSRAVLLVTHDLERGLACADRAALLARGRVTAEGTPDEIAARLAEILPKASVVT
jgi:heme exporter protein A